MFGPGIYWATTKSKAKSKALYATAGESVVITAKIWLGFMLYVPAARPTLTREEVYGYGCHSIHGKARSGDEYILFDPENVASVDLVEDITDD
jgi:hypothetical protein